MHISASIILRWNTAWGGGFVALMVESCCVGNLFLLRGGKDGD